MALAMLVNDDPNATVGQVVLLSVVSMLFGAFAAYVYRPVLAMSRLPDQAPRTANVSEGIVRQR